MMTFIEVLITCVLCAYIVIYGLGYMFKGDAGGKKAIQWINKNLVFPIIDGIGKIIAKSATKHPRIVGFIIIAIVLAIIIYSNDPRLH